MKKQLLTLILIFVFSPKILLSQENTSITCSDGIDNDGDGQVDCLDSECQSLPSNGCLICTEGISFADTLLEYTSGCPNPDPDPSGALGVSDWTGATTNEPEFVSLGQGGILKMGFTNNVLTNSGDPQEDLWVFEVGPAVESSDLALRPADIFTEDQLDLFGIIDVNADGYYEIGNISGSTSGFDIDGLLPGYSAGELKFDAIEIKDVDDGSCSGTTAGADIDAVCALSSLTVDCSGTANGTFVVDDCGECLDPTDPNFNQSCADCSGTANGTFVVDDCGECLDPTDPNFNQSCTDCSGTPNGTFVQDDCGECLDPTNPNFNQSCNSENLIYIPNVFSPNDDGINDKFQIFGDNDKVAQVIKYLIFDRWGTHIFESFNFMLDSSTDWWEGRYKGKELNSGVFVYLIEIELQSGKTKVFNGAVLLIK